MAKMSNYSQYVEVCVGHGKLDKPHIDKFRGLWGYWGGEPLNSDNKHALNFVNKLNAKEAKDAD